VRRTCAGASTGLAGAERVGLATFFVAVSREACLSNRVRPRPGDNEATSAAGDGDFARATAVNLMGAAAVADTCCVDVVAVPVVASFWVSVAVRVKVGEVARIVSIFESEVLEFQRVKNVLCSTEAEEEEEEEAKSKGGSAMTMLCKGRASVYPATI